MTINKISITLIILPIKMILMVNVVTKNGVNLLCYIQIVFFFFFTEDEALVVYIISC